MFVARLLEIPAMLDSLEITMPLCTGAGEMMALPDQGLRTWGPKGPAMRLLERPRGFPEGPFLACVATPALNAMRFSLFKKIVVGTAFGGCKQVKAAVFVTHADR